MLETLLNLTEKEMNTKKILIVEDEWMIADEIKYIVEENGYEVIAIAKSGEEAIAIAEKQQPDLILMDIHLKGNVDGIEAAKQIGEKNYCIPIVYLSDPKSSVVVKYAGRDNNQITDFLTKPIVPKQLAITIAFNLAKVGNFPPPPSIPQDFFFVRSGKNEQIPIQVKDVLFFETDGTGTGALVILATKEYPLDRTLTKFLKTFPHPSFVKVHRSYAVNVSHIKNIQTKDQNIHFKKFDNVLREDHKNMRFFKKNLEEQVWNGIIPISKNGKNNLRDALNMPT